MALKESGVIAGDFWKLPLKQTQTHPNRLSNVIFNIIKLNISIIAYFNVRNKPLEPLPKMCPA